MSKWFNEETDWPDVDSVIDYTRTPDDWLPIESLIAKIFSGEENIKDELDRVRDGMRSFYRGLRNVSLERLFTLEVEKHVKSQVQALNDSIQQVAPDDASARVNLFRSCYNRLIDKIHVFEELFRPVENEFLVTVFICLTSCFWDFAESFQLSQVTLKSAVVLLAHRRRSSNVNLENVKDLLRIFYQDLHTSAVCQKYLCDEILQNYGPLAKQADEPVFTFLQRTKEWLLDEDKRCCLFMSKDMKDGVLRSLKDDVILANTSELLEELRRSLDAKQLEHIECVFNISQGTRHTNDFAQVLFHYITERWTSILEEDQYADNILEFVRYVNVISLGCFPTSPVFLDRINSELLELIHQIKEEKFLPIVRCMVDQVITLDSGDGQLLVLRTISLFLKHNMLKYSFQLLYVVRLSVRLLQGNYLNIATEIDLLKKMEECGCDDTFKDKSSDMLQDVKSSLEISNIFKDKFGTSMDSLVLTPENWQWEEPAGMGMEMPPNLISKWQTAFRKFYLAREPGSDLVFDNTSSTCLLSVQFDDEEVRFESTFNQFLVLRLFGSLDESWTYREILERTGLDDSRLKAVLTSLCDSSLLCKALYSTDEADAFYTVEESFTPQDDRLKDSAVFLEGQLQTVIAKLERGW